MNLGLNYQRQKSGQRTVVSYFMKFVRIFAGVYCTGGDERDEEGTRVIFKARCALDLYCKARSCNATACRPSVYNVGDGGY